MNVNTQNAPPTSFTSSEYWSIPATHPQAVYAFADLQVISEHLSTIERIREDTPPFMQAEAIDNVVGAAARRATEVSEKIRKAVKPKMLALFEDLDVVRAMPDQITFMPRVVWLLGALAALASVRATAVAVSVGGVAPGIDRTRALADALRQAATEARSRWDSQADELLRRHPWVRGQHVHFELVDLETPRPRFRIPIVGG